MPDHRFLGRYFRTSSYRGTNGARGRTSGQTSATAARAASAATLVTRTAAYWQESWLPRFDGPNELSTVAVFETRLAIALRASNHNRS